MMHNSNKLRTLLKKLENDTTKYTNEHLQQSDISVALVGAEFEGLHGDDKLRYLEEIGGCPRRIGMAGNGYPSFTKICGALSC